MLFQSLKVFGPLASKGVVLWVLPSIIENNFSKWTPSGAGLVIKVLWDDNLAPFSSNKILADFGLRLWTWPSITAGVRMPHDYYHRGVV